MFGAQRYFSTICQQTTFAVQLKPLEMIAPTSSPGVLRPSTCASEYFSEMFSIRMPNQNRGMLYRVAAWSILAVGERLFNVVSFSD
jgi:hypothetical protein